MLCALALAAGIGTARAHREIEVQLKALDHQIASQPGKVVLYLRRADLHRRHRDWKKALSDLDRASELAPNRLETCLGRAQTLLDMDDAKAALGIIDRYLLAHPPARAAAALAQLEARCARSLDNRDRARAAYDRALANLERPTPGLYLEAAEAMLQPDAHSASREAIELLDQGSRRLGFVPVLERRALELERAASQLEAAARRCERVLSLSTAPSLDWRILHGQILLKLGRKKEAAAAFQAVLDRHAGLPLSRRNTPAQAAFVLEARRGLVGALSEAAPAK